MQKTLGIKLNETSVNHTIAIATGNSQVLKALAENITTSPSKIHIPFDLYKDMELIHDFFNSIQS